MEARYLGNGPYIAALQLSKAKEEIQPPNLAYVLDYNKHLQIAGKDPRTVARQTRELRFIMKALGKQDTHSFSRYWLHFDTFDDNALRLCKNVKLSKSSDSAWKSIIDDKYRSKLRQSTRFLNILTVLPEMWLWT